MFFPKLCCHHQCMLYEMSLLIYKWFWVLISILKHIQTNKPRTRVHNVKYVCLDARNSSTEEDHHRTPKIDRCKISFLGFAFVFVSNRLHGIQSPTISVHCADCWQKHSHGLSFCSFVPFFCTKNDSLVVYDNTIGSSPEREIYMQLFIVTGNAISLPQLAAILFFFSLNNLYLKNDLTKYIEIFNDALW